MLQKRKKYGGGRRLFAYLMAIAVLLTSLLGAGGLPAAADNTIPAVKLSEYHDGNQYLTTLTVENGAQYTLSFLWKAVENTPSLALYGNAITESGAFPLMTGNVAQNGTIFDYVSGRAAFTFTAKGSELTISIDATAGWQYCEAYFAAPSLQKVNNKGEVLEEVDCHPDFSTEWGVSWGGGYSVTAKEESFFGTKIYDALSSLSVEGYELSPAFSNALTSYSLTVPYMQESLNVDYTLGSEGKSAVVTGHEALVEGGNTVKISVTTTDDTVIDFIIHVTKKEDESRYLRAYYMGNNGEGQSIDYQVTVEAGTTYTFTVLWEFVTGSTPHFDLSGSAVGGTAKKLIVGDVPQDGVVYDVAKGKVSYTFTAQGTTLGMDACLPVTGWSEYNEIYFAKPTLYESDAQGNKIGDAIDCNDGFDPLWSHYLGGLQQVKLVSKDFFDNQIYDSLASLTVNGYTLSPAFENYITTYFVTVPHTVDSLDLQCVLGSDGKRFEISGNAGFVEGSTQSVTVSVTNQDNSVTNYTIRVTKEVDPSKYMTAMRLSEWSDAAVTNTVLVTSGKTYTFKVQWKYVQGTNPYFSLGGTVDFGSSALYGVKKLVEADKILSGVKYDWDADAVSYTFTAVGEYLMMQAGMGGIENTELRDVYFANPTLYESDQDGNPIAGGEVIDCDPEFKTAWEKWSYGGNYRHVVQVEKDFFHLVKTNALTSLDVGYDLSVPFDGDTLFYEVTVPYHVSRLENIQYTFADGATLSEITGNEGFEEGGTTDVIIAVNNDGGGLTKYVIRVFRSREPSPQILSLDVGYEMDSTFNPNITAYTLSVPGGVQSLTLQYTLSENTTLVSIEGNGGFQIGVPQDVVITVANTKGQQVAYILTVTSGGSGSASSAEQNLLNEVAAALSVSNATDKAALENALKEALAGSGYEIAVSDFYLLKASTRVTDNYGVIIPGEKGYITAVVNMVKDGAFVKLPLKLTIEPPLKEYTFTEDEVSKDSDFILSSDGKTAEYFGGDAKKIVIPDGVETIEFAWNDALYPEKVLVFVIPDSVKNLPLSVAFGMQNLEAVYVGNGVTELAENAFDQCMFLQYVHLPQNLKVIGDRAFRCTFSLTELRLPEGLREIRKEAFSFSLIRSITVPANVQRIGLNAFSNCFNSAYQLVVGSDNVEKWYPFTRADHPDLLRLQALSDSVVDYYTEDGAHRWDTLDESPIGDPSWPYGELFCTPRTVTLLCRDAEIEDRAFYSLGIWCAAGNQVRIPADAASYSAMKEEETSGLYITHYPYLFTKDLDMSPVEAAAHAQYRADRIAVTSKSTADSIAAAIAQGYVSTKINALVWLEAFSITDGIATGVLGLGADTLLFPIELNAALSSETANSGISIVPGSDLARLDAVTHKLYVKNGLTIAQFMEVLRVSDGLFVEFYDDDGYYIPEEYYGTAILEDHFVLKTVSDGMVAEEYTVEVEVGSIRVPRTGEDFPAALAVTALLSLGVISIFRRRKKQ